MKRTERWAVVSAFLTQRDSHAVVTHVRLEASVKTESRAVEVRDEMKARDPLVNFTIMRINTI